MPSITLSAPSTSAPGPVPPAPCAPQSPSASAAAAAASFGDAAPSPRPAHRLALALALALATCLALLVLVSPSSAWVSRLLAPRASYAPRAAPLLSSGVPALMQKGGELSSRRIALCIAGNARTLELPLVHEKILRYVVNPLRRHSPTDVFILLKMEDNPRPGRPEANIRLNATLHAVSLFSPAVFVLLNATHDFASPQVDPDNPREVHIPATCARAPHADVTAIMPHTLHRTSQCLDAILSHEARTGIRYAWLYRARPDVAFLDPIILPSDMASSDSGKVVYTNSSPWPSVRHFASWWASPPPDGCGGNAEDVPSYGDHFLAGPRAQALVAFRAIEAVHDCKFFDMPGIRNSEAALGFWLLSHGIHIRSKLWAWALVRAQYGPECERLDMIPVGDSVRHEAMKAKCESYIDEFRAAAAAANASATLMPGAERSVSNETDISLETVGEEAVTEEAMAEEATVDEEEFEQDVDQQDVDQQDVEVEQQDVEVEQQDLEHLEQEQREIEQQQREIVQQEVEQRQQQQERDSTLSQSGAI